MHDTNSVLRKMYMHSLMREKDTYLNKCNITKKACSTPQSWEIYSIFPVHCSTAKQRRIQVVILLLWVPDFKFKELILVFLKLFFQNGTSIIVFLIWKSVDYLRRLKKIEETLIASGRDCKRQGVLILIVLLLSPLNFVPRTSIIHEKHFSKLIDAHCNRHYMIYIERYKVENESTPNATMNTTLWYPIPSLGIHTCIVFTKTGLWYI